MFLTRFWVNPARRGGRHLLASPQRMHAAVMSSFPPGAEAAGERGRVLWRLDASEGHRTALFVVSPHRPDLTHLVEQAGWPTSETWETREYGDFLDRLAVGQSWAFRVTANPVQSVRVPGRRGQVRAHVTVLQQQTWMADRLPGLGLRLLGDGEPPLPLISGRRTPSFDRREQDGGSGRVTVAMATFDGVAEVSDADALRRALTHGIGRARAYGCGLMTLAPVR